MGNMKFDGPDVTFELDGFDALAERVHSKKINCKINPSDLPRLYAVMDAELEGNEELSAAFAEAQEAAFNNAVLAVWAERIKSFKDSFIPVFGDACKDAACRFGFSKDGSNTFKSAADAFAANICDLYGAAPQIVDGFCEFLARNACLEFDGYAADMPVPCQLYVAEGISKMAYQQAMNSVRGFKLDTDASVEFAEKFINDNVTTPDSFMHLNDACVAIENVMAATSPAAVPETAAVAAPAAEVDDAPVPAATHRVPGARSRRRHHRLPPRRRHRLSRRPGRGRGRPGPGRRGPAGCIPGRLSGRGRGVCPRAGRLRPTRDLRRRRRQPVRRL